MKSTKKPTQRLHVDWTRCDGRGLCVELLPDVLRRDPWGYPLARDAVGRCPRLALSLLATTPETRGRHSAP
jgi:ferredoxin